MKAPLATALALAIASVAACRSPLVVGSAIGDDGGPGQPDAGPGDAAIDAAGSPVLVVRVVDGLPFAPPDRSLMGVRVVADTHIGGRDQRYEATTTADGIARVVGVDPTAIFDLTLFHEGYPIRTVLALNSCEGGPPVPQPLVVALGSAEEACGCQGTSVPLQIHRAGAERGPLVVSIAGSIAEGAATDDWVELLRDPALGDPVSLVAIEVSDEWGVARLFGIARGDLAGAASGGIALAAPTAARRRTWNVLRFDVGGPTETEPLVVGVAERAERDLQGATIGQTTLLPATGITDVSVEYQDDSGGARALDVFARLETDEGRTVMITRRPLDAPGSIEISAPPEVMLAEGAHVAVGDLVQMHRPDWSQAALVSLFDTAGTFWTIVLPCDPHRTVVLPLLPAGISLDGWLGAEVYAAGAAFSVRDGDPWDDHAFLHDGIADRESWGWSSRTVFVESE